jgi:hypothetical protein
MKDIIFEFRYVITVVLALIVYAIFNWQKTIKLVRSGILWAKSHALEMARDAVLLSGQAQEDWVVSTVYPLLPLPAKILISEALFRKIVQRTYRGMKDYLDDGKFNNSTEVSDG